MFDLRVASMLALVAFGSACKASPEQAAAGSASSKIPGFLPSPREFAEQHRSFETYWYQGKAELTRYALRQYRYGEQHEGDAVLIFVTEPFLPERQVKQEHGDDEDAISVLKLNAYRRFDTGIYPYTLMTSAFTPVEPAGAPALKLSNTVQEWCGQAFTQLNRRADGLHAVLYSYRQDEGDQSFSLPDARLEDELWAQLRIDPSSITEGEQELVPALSYIRLQHRPLRAYPARLSRLRNAKTALVQTPVDALTIEYPSLDRKLTIYYEPAFPFAILAWEEHVGPEESTAVRSHAIIDDYWQHNAVGDEAYRRALGL